MGIKESFPIIRGKSVKFNLPNEEKYFERSRRLIKMYCAKNDISDYNLIKSLEVKTFIGGKIEPKKDEIKDMNWIEYINIHLTNLYHKYQVPWITQFLHFINNKNIHISENKYCSNIFYCEYQLFTMPKKLISENDKFSKEIEIHNKLIGQENETELHEYSSSERKSNNDYLEIEVVDNFGGSYIKFSQDNIPLQYEENRKKVKYYIKKIKEDLYNNEDHPFHLAIKNFNEEFGKYIIQKIKDNEVKLKKEIFDQKKYEFIMKNLEEEINFCLKEVISRMYSALKLFYSTTIDFMSLQEEKDDLFNLVISTFFRIGDLYENISELYNKCFQNELRTFQERLIKLKNINPKQLGIQIKFCLNDDTLYLQKELKEKNKNENNDDKLEKINEEDENETVPKTLKIETILNEKTEEDDNKEEIRNDKEDQNIFGDLNINNMNLIKDKYNITENDFNAIIYKNSFINNPIRSKTRRTVLSNEENNILENIPNIDSFNNDYWNNYDPSEPIRNTINNFNNKKYFFPNLNKQLKNNLENPIYVNNKISSKTPYFTAINLLKSINKYKTPFEKIILLAAISDLIMESATNFWKGMESYIKKDFLFIDSDEILKIFLFILIQAQMPEIILECKIIDNFTSDLTKTFNLTYNYTLLEASIDYINGKNDINELNTNGDILIDASKEIIGRTSQRLSRISLGMMKGQI